MKSIKELQNFELFKTGRDGDTYMRYHSKDAPLCIRVKNNDGTLYLTGDGSFITWFLMLGIFFNPNSQVEDLGFDLSLLRIVELGTLRARRKL